MHFDPPIVGTGLSQFRVLLIVPEPQVELQDDQKDHDPQCPLTGKMFKHRKVGLKCCSILNF